MELVTQVRARRGVTDVPRGRLLRVYKKKDDEVEGSTSQFDAQDSLVVPPL